MTFGSVSQPLVVLSHGPVSESMPAESPVCQRRAAKVAERNVKMRQRAVTGGVVQPAPGSSIGQPYQQHQQHQQQQRVYSASSGVLCSPSHCGRHC